MVVFVVLIVLVVVYGVFLGFNGWIFFDIGGLGCDIVLVDL